MWKRVAMTAAAQLAFAGAAVAQPGANSSTPVPSERLTLADLVVHAAPPVQLVMAVLLAGLFGSVVVWGASLSRVGAGDAKALATALGRLRIVRSGAAPLGALAASYGVVLLFIGIANVRPSPSLGVLAPGFAEAFLALALGFGATAVAAVCERHLEARIRRAAV